MNTVSKFVVALDPVHQDERISAEKVAGSIQGIVGTTPSEVEAVYVMTPEGVGLELPNFPEQLDRFRARAKEILTERVGNYPKGVSTRVTVLPCGLNSIRECVSTLLEHATKSKADLIALGTHGRQGMDRYFLGSFAETMLLQSSIPLLISNPAYAWDPAFKHILFATDLAEDASETAQWVISFAKQIHARITIFHRIGPDISLFAPPGIVGEEALRSFRLSLQAKALAVKAQAKSEGVPAEIVMDSEDRRVSDAIRATATHLGTSLIVLGAKSRSKFSAVGSIARQVVRHAPCPVLVVPQKIKNK